MILSLSPFLELIILRKIQIIRWGYKIQEDKGRYHISPCCFEALSYSFTFHFEIVFIRIQSPSQKSKMERNKTQHSSNAPNLPLNIHQMCIAESREELLNTIAHICMRNYINPNQLIYQNNIQDLINDDQLRANYDIIGVERVDDDPNHGRMNIFYLRIERRSVRQFCAKAKLISDILKHMERLRNEVNMKYKKVPIRVKNMEVEIWNSRIIWGIRRGWRLIKIGIMLHKSKIKWSF